MSKRWTLVTGATGFIGSALVRRLIERGVYVKAFVRPGSDLRVFEDLPHSQFCLAYGDVTIESTVYRALLGCRSLFHVASVFRYWDRDPERIIAPAVLGTRAVLSAAECHGIERIVVTSSAAILGVSDGETPMDERHANNLSDPETYVRAKVEAERVVDERVAAGAPIISVLPCAVFGAGDRKPTPNGRTLLDYLKLAPSRRIPVTSGGVSIVDVEDVAEGHVLAMEEGNIGEKYLLGGENVTFRELFQHLHELTGLARSGNTPSRWLLSAAAALLETGSRLGGGDPLLTRKLARDYAFSRVWVTSAKAERELGYTYRPARETLTRALRYYVTQGYLEPELASRVRLALRSL